MACGGSNGKYALNCSDHHFIEQSVLPRWCEMEIPGLFVGSGRRLIDARVGCVRDMRLERYVFSGALGGQ
jgi:hypothetical protein